ncbi:hypothetical protein FS749_009330 [Ceratobasidium sp. UAMH 11750]|nr:hypothetical protein FS749_009330 [Ceratobasidium sp. UAMH 11750]
MLGDFGYLVFLREMLDLEFEEEPDLEELDSRMLLDLAAYHTILTTRYWAPRGSIPRSGSLHTLWTYAANPDYHHLFNKLVRVRPATFRFILDEIKDNPRFRNNSTCPQAPVELQLAITLHRLGRYGNGASMDDIAFLAGVGHGTVPLYTKRVIAAILDLHGRYIRTLTDEERTREREWVWQRMGCPEFAAGIFQYDGTLIELWQKPGLHGNAYFHRNHFYGMNVQIGCIGSNLQITDYSLGFTGAAHDSLAFRETAAYKHPDLLFHNDEFAWADSAYTPSYRVIPVHRAPANRDPRIRAFDKAVSHLRQCDRSRLVSSCTTCASQLVETTGNQTRRWSTTSGTQSSSRLRLRFWQGQSDVTILLTLTTVIGTTNNSQYFLLQL